MSEIRVAVAGLGYWGPVLARNFASHPRTSLAALVDLRLDRIEAAQREFTSVPGFTELADALPLCDAVAIAAPVSRHFPIAMEALQAGKHLFVEKPFTHTSAEAEALLAEAEKRGLVIAVDHILLFSGMVRKVKEIVDSGELGDILFFHSTRANLGKFQTDGANVIWDLGPHDLSMMLHFFGEPHRAFPPAGSAHMPAGLTDDVHLHYRYGHNMMASVYLSWLYPDKNRTAVIGGSNKSLVFSDLVQGREIQVYDRRVTSSKVDGSWDYQYHSGGVVIPDFDRRMPLGVELDEFAAAIVEGMPLTSDGRMGLQVVRLLEQCDAALAKANGE